MVGWVGGSSECSTALMTRCTDPLTMVTDRGDLSFASSKQELDRMCPKLMDGLTCINSFTVRCLTRDQRSYFNMLYSGTIQVIEDLCMEGPYQTDYLRHAPCMKSVQTQYQHCSDTYKQTLHIINTHQGKEDKVGLLCCSFQEYLDCSQRVVNNTCGFHTASFTKGFLDRMAKPLAKGHCQSYPAGSYHCKETTTHSAIFSTVFMASSVGSSDASSVVFILVIGHLVSNS